MHLGTAGMPVQTLILSTHISIDAMSEYTADDPVLVTTKNVSQSGSLYLGDEFAGTRVRVIIESAETSDDANLNVSVDDGDEGV